MTSSSLAKPLFLLVASFLIWLVRPIFPSPAPPSTATDADRSFLSSVAAVDSHSADSLLDNDFTWTDRSGKTRPKSEVLAMLSEFSRDPDSDVVVSEHGQVVLIRGAHRLPSQNAAVRFARVWVQRPSGWKLLIYQKTPKAEKTPEKRAGFGSPSGGAPVKYENPCKTVPYKPDGAAETEIVSMWQAGVRA